MAYEFKLPDLGEGLTEGEIARWLVAEGQEIGEDDPLVEIQTDKTTVEIPSPAAGKVARIFVAEGETVAVGTVLVVIGEDGGAPPASDEQPRAEGATQKQPARGISDVSARLAPGHASPGRVRATPLVRRLALSGDCHRVVSYYLLTMLVKASVTRSRSLSVRRVWNGSATARSKTRDAPGNSRRSR